MKQGSLNDNELEAFVSALVLAGGKSSVNSTLSKKPRESSPQMPGQKLITSLEAMGVRIYGLDAQHQNNSYSEISWENIAGYDRQKQYVETQCILCSLFFHFQSNIDYANII